jgi:preprotein translocase subunit SecG
MLAQVFAWPDLLVYASLILFLIVCIVMVLTVLIQRPQGGGLSGAFGAGVGSSQTAFGAKTGDALTVFTIVVFVVYILAAILLNYGATPASVVAKERAAREAAGAATTPLAPGAVPGTGAAPAVIPGAGAPGAVVPMPAPATPATTPTTPATTPTTTPVTPPAAEPAPTAAPTTEPTPAPSGG